ncbi:galactose mutarotase [Roseiconus nitratireducens]|uniref:Aldose 1-epimerase n=1 Tax=Roseiconus nitratireducens TaxID=2605748 RepID=A0A5M6CXF4_9BACT|nr:aldose epimerase family protein [Roseiconus nitratireducens]KAA5539914.1 galactose mutarotase [Roseiconus nitratireducens]
MKIETAPFGTVADQPITRYTLVNSHGHRVSVMNFGATLLEVEVPDRDGKLANVNLCFDSLQPYVDGHPYFGSTVGRFCNRIGNAKFTIDGVEYPLVVNHGKHQLHGGKQNFSYQIWSAEPYEGPDKVGVRFSHVSPDGDNGFPGTVSVITDYSWNDADELTIRYTATTDQPTHINLTNHSYWNLGGAGSGTAMDHVATIHADQYLDVDGDLIPTGKLNDVEGTPLDFRTPTTLGKRLEELPATKGYDHCYVVRGEPGDLRTAATVIDPDSGRILDIETTQPGIQLYTANHLGGGPETGGFGSHEAFCLETQHYPDAPNKPDFPSTLLKPGQTLEETTVHRFDVQ